MPKQPEPIFREAPPAQEDDSDSSEEDEVWK